jgi:hypothetical protein
LGDERRVGGIVPEFTPKDSEDLDVGEERAVAIGEVRGGSSGIARWAGMEGDDAKREFDFGPRRFGGWGLVRLLGDRSRRHEGSLPAERWLGKERRREVG